MTQQINSRDLDDLNPEARAKAKEFLRQAKAAGFDVLVTSTFRNAASQDWIYAQGRTRPGSVVTRARAGFSWHQFRCALDIVPLVNGKPDWNDLNKFNRLGAIGEACGLEWGGSWKSFKDYPHFQHTGGLSMAQLRAKYGKEAPRTW